MAPLDLMSFSCEIAQPEVISQQLDKLQEIHVDGIMVDVWWKIAQPLEDKFNFSGYRRFFEMCNERGMKIMPVLSFHACYDDGLTIDLPDYIIRHNFGYVDADKKVNKEYIPPSFDNDKLGNLTPIEYYEKFMKAFKNEFKDMIKEGIISGIEVGLGPCGELRYPSYCGEWRFPNAGAIQCFDEYSLKNMKNQMIKPPIWATKYNESPNTIEEWKNVESNEQALEFFRWYNGVLCDHADIILSLARQIFGFKVRLFGKIPGIHWWYSDSSRCAEATAGFVTYEPETGYERILKVFSLWNVGCCFTCLEKPKCKESHSDPQRLVKEIYDASTRCGIEFSGENAQETYDSGDFKRIVSWRAQGMNEFTFLRFGSSMMKNQNFKAFTKFVKAMHANKVFI